jgi:hypothetical protein
MGTREELRLIATLIGLTILGVGWEWPIVGTLARVLAHR